MADTREKLIFEVEVQSDKALKRVEELTAQQKLLREELRDINKAYKSGEITLDDYSRRTAAVNIELKNVGTELRTAQKAVTTTTGSLNEQRIELSKLLKQYDNFSIGVNGTEEEFKDLEKRIQSLTEEVSGFERGTGRHQRNVGNYREAITGAFDSIGVSAAQLATGPLAAAFAVQKIIEATVAVIQYGKELSKIRKETALLTGASDATLNQIVAGNQAIADSIEGVDYSEVLQFNTKAANIFNESQEKAIELSSKLFSTQADGGQAAISTFESIANRF